MRTIRLSRPVLLGLGIVGLSVAGGLLPVVGQAKEGCSLATLHGAFGTRETGTIPGPDGSRLEIAIVARVVFDGRGHFSGADTASIGGQIARNETFAGTYTVTADCAGSETGTAKSTGLVFHEDFVVTDHGQQAYLIGTDPGTVLSGTASKQED